jgi:hypothetical protein
MPAVNYSTNQKIDSLRPKKQNQVAFGMELKLGQTILNKPFSAKTTESFMRIKKIAKGLLPDEVVHIDLEETRRFFSKARWQKETPYINWDVFEYTIVNPNPQKGGVPSVFTNSAITNKESYPRFEKDHDIIIEIQKNALEALSKKYQTLILDHQNAIADLI